MREYELQLDEALHKGLRKHHRNPRNVQAAIECHNMRIGEAGLEPYIPLTNPFSNLKYSWPFPQIIEAKSFAFLIVREDVEMEDRIYSFTNGVWSLSSVFDVDVATFDQGRRFSIADFEDYVLLTNGVVMIRYDIALDAFVPFTSSDEIPLCNSICAAKGGQAVAGGVRSSWHDRGLNSIVWSRIGYMDFTPGRDNEAGFRNSDSEVYGVLRLEDDVVVYGSKSMGRLSPVREPAPTLGWKEIASYGICGPYAVGGGIHQHVFVDEDRWIWRVDPGVKLSKLGYQEFMKQLDKDLLTVVYRRTNNDYFISDGTKSFLLTNSGLSSVHQCVSGLIRYDETDYGVFKDTGDLNFRLVSDVFDMGFRSTKTLGVIEVGADSAHTMRAGADWRIQRSKRFIRSALQPVNDQGVAYPIVAGNEFRIVLESSYYEDTNVDYLKCRYKMTDLRSIRGVYAPPPRGQ